MAEQLTLTTPVVQTRTTYELIEMHFNWPRANIEIVLIGSDGEPVSRFWTGAVATARMSTMNTANFSGGTSMQKRAWQLLQADFPEFAGVVSGVPR